MWPMSSSQSVGAHYNGTIGALGAQHDHIYIGTQQSQYGYIFLRV